MFRDDRFLKKAPTIVCLVALQGMLNIVANLVGTLMIGAMGATAIVVVGLANKFFFVLPFLVFGIVSGSGVLATQLQGNGNLRSIQKVLGFPILLALTGALFFIVPTPVSLQSVMRIFTTNHDDVEPGSEYLKIVILARPFLAMTNVYVAILKAVNKVVFPVINSCITIVISICLGYVLTFGKLGMPAIGVSGAAVVTLVARIIEIVLTLEYVYGKRLPVACGLQDLFDWSRLFISRFFGTSAPVIANEFIRGLGTTMYSLTCGRMGDEAVAAITITTTIQDILVVLSQGLSAATAVILGNKLGVGHSERVEKYVIYFFTLQFIVTVGVAVVLIGTRWSIISPYNTTPEVARGVSLCILILAVYMPTEMSSYINVAGMLRSGGDTKTCLFPDTSGAWFIGVPLAFLGVLVWRLSTCTMYALVMMEEVYRAALGYIRYRQKKRLRNLASDVG